ncbi:MAG: hypothetical protein IKR10_01540, partial [Firmicutes bacterium]|nr:hypothetical protein [Bacillota bacterium]
MVKVFSVTEMPFPGRVKGNQAKTGPKGLFFFDKFGFRGLVKAAVSILPRATRGSGVSSVSERKHRCVL